MNNEKKPKQNTWQPKNYKGIPRWVIVSSILAVVVILGLAGLYKFYSYYQSPERFLQRARELAEQGEYKAASDQYSRALRRIRNTDKKVEVLGKILEMTFNRAPAPPAEVYKNSYNIFNIYSSIIRETVDRSAPAKRALEAAYKLAESIKTPAYWRHLQNTAEQVKRLDEDNLLARKYLSIAKLFSRSSEEQTEGAYDRLQENFADLREASSEKDPDLYYYEAKTLVTEASDLKQDYLESRRRSLYQEANDLMEEYLEDNSDDMVMRARLLRIKMQWMLAVDDPEPMQSFFREQDLLWEQLNNNPDAEEKAVEELAKIYFLLSRVADGNPQDGKNEALNAEMDVMTMSERARSLFKELAGEDPIGLMAIYWLAMLERENGKLDEALHNLNRVLSDKIEFSPGMDAIIAWEFQVKAHDMRIDIWLEQYQESGDEKLIAQVKSEMDGLRESLGEDSHYLKLLEGRVAYLEGDYFKALNILDQSAEIFGKHPQILLYQGLSLMRMGETGVAMNKLEEYRHYPDRNQRRRRQALAAFGEAAIRLRELDNAVDVFRRLREEYPEWQEGQIGLVRALNLQIRSRNIEIDEEMRNEIDELSEDMLASDDETSVRQAIMWFIQTERLERIKGFLENYCKGKPQTGWAQFMLYETLRRQDKYQEARDRLQNALSVAPDNRVKDYLKKAIADDENWAPHLETLMQLVFEKDDKQRKIELLQLLHSLQLTEEMNVVIEDLKRIAPDDLGVLEARFDIAFASQNWTAAERVAEQAAAQDKTGFSSELWKARLQIARDDNSAAVRRLKRLLTDNIEYSQIYTLLGIAHENLGDLGQAQENYEKALERRPENILATQRLTVVAAARGFDRQALKYMERGLWLNPNNEALMQNYLNYLDRVGRGERALEIRRKIAEMHPDNRSNRLEIANVYLRNRNFDEARKLLDELRTEAPDDFTPVLLTARMKAIQGKKEEGVSLLESFLEKQGEAAGAVAWTQFAEFLEQTGAEAAEVEDAVEKGLELEEDILPVASKYLAGFRLRQGEGQESLDILEELYERTGDHSILLRIAETNLRLDNLQEAREKINAYLVEGRMTPEVGILQARILIADKKTEEALRTLDKVIAMAPGRGQAYLLRAQLLWDNPEIVRESDSIRDDLETAVETGRDLLQARYMLALLSRREGDIESGIKHLLRLTRERPQNNLYRNTLARFYMAAKRYDDLDEFISEWNKMIEGQEIMPLLWRGWLERERGNYSRAREIYQALYEKAPDERNVVLEYANLLGKIGEYQGMRRLLENASENYGEQPAFMLALGRALAGSDQEEEAMSLFAKIFAQADGNRKLQQRVLKTSFEVLPESIMDDFYDKISAYDQEGIIKMFQAFVDYQKGEWSKASDKLRELSMEINQDSPIYLKTMLMLGSSLSKLNQNEEAKEIYQILYKIVPDNPFVLNNLAYEMATTGDRPNEAVELAEKALGLIDSDNIELRASVLDTKGYAQYSAGLNSLAEITLQRSRRVNETVNTYVNLGQVFLAQGRPQEAINALQSAKELNSSEVSDQQLREKADRLLEEAREKMAEEQAEEQDDE